MGSTHIRNQERKLNLMFPKSNSEMNQDDKKQYKEYLRSLPSVHRKKRRVIDNFVPQICALQYIPRDRRWSPQYTQGTVAYFNAKVKGKKAGKQGETLIKPPLTVAWVNFCFVKKYVDILVQDPRKWHRVVIGHTRPVDDVAPVKLQTQVPMAFPQGDRDQCLFLCLASALHYIGMSTEAVQVASIAASAEVLPGNKAIELLSATMKEHVPTIGIGVVYNSSHKRRKKRTLTLSDLVSRQTMYPTMVLPLGTDGSVSHAICVVDDLIFDSTQPWALKCTIASLNWICNCGSRGFEEVNLALRFQEPYKSKPMKREIVKNWNT
jgi:hypothetical protein